MKEESKSLQIKMGKVFYDRYMIPITELDMNTKPYAADF